MSGVFARVDAEYFRGRIASVIASLFSSLRGETYAGGPVSIVDTASPGGKQTYRNVVQQHFLEKA